MIIDLICNDGSPLGVTLDTVYGKDSKQIGVGGAEIALLTMCEEWHNAGYDITLYNNPRKNNVGLFKQAHINQFDHKKDGDFLIVFRSPNDRMFGARGKKIW